MARPKEDDTKPCAKKRLQQALWDMLGSEPFDRLSVKQLCAAAGIRRNSFYYHYDGVYDLAYDAVAELPIEQFAQGLLEHAKSGSADMLSYVLAQQNASIFHKIRLIAGYNGSPVLVELYKRRVWQVWRSILDLPEDPPLVFDFAIGGLLAVFVQLESTSDTDFLAHCEQIPMQEMFQVVFSSLKQNN